MALRRGKFDEAAAWKGLIAGDKSAFQSIYEEYFGMLYRYGRKVSGDATKVEDSIQDLFMDLWRYRENLSFTTSIRFYLFRALRRKIVKNEARDTGANIFDFDINEVQLLNSLSAEDAIIADEKQNEQIAKLMRNLNNLSGRQHEALLLKFYSDFSYAEIGELLGINEQSARNIVQRALEQLRNFARIIPVVLTILFSLS